MKIDKIKYKNFKASVTTMSRKTATEHGLYGFYTPNNNTIVIQKDLNKKIYLDTLIHEIFHFVADKSKVNFRNLGEEGIAKFVGTEFSKILIQNPKLVNLIKRCCN
tara:strand:+ start:1878 stop:2195 length:318 start_codon:yes stop_codon:yes gene_type:complete